MRQVVALSVFSLLGLAVACTAGTAPMPGAGAEPSGSAATSPPTTGAGAAVTYHKDVEPIVQAHCQKCHAPGGIGPFSLLTYAGAKDYAQLMAEKTAERVMPPWGALDTAECKPRFGWKDDERLTDAEIATIKAWSDGGALEGDPKDAPPAPAPKPTDLPGASALTAKAPFSLGAGTKDTLRCFVLDPKLAARRYMTGTFFVPTNKSIVHHALAFAIPEGAKTPGDADEYECPGGSGVDGARLVAAWAPGSVPAVYPTDAALVVDAGTRFVMQIHYHPHANASPTPDLTAFQYAMTDTPPKYVVLTTLIGNFGSAPKDGRGLLPGPADPPSGPEFLIPPNAKGHTETMTFTMPTSLGGKPIPAKLGILGVGAHMHLAGVDERISIKRAAPSASAPADECLLQEPKWNFDWQRGFQYDTPLDNLPSISPGDTLTIRCTYDNTMSNRKISGALREQGLSQPKEIRLGEQTLDEMCLGALSLVVKL